MHKDDLVRLDNPVWAALTADHASLGAGTGLARRYQADIAPFAGVREPTSEALHDLAGLLAPDEGVMLLTTGDLAPCDAATIRRLFDVRQMIDLGEAGEPAAQAIPLSPADAANMLDLAGRTQPGPFGPRTGTMGHYIGIRDEGRLVAMAGERLHVGRYIEISAVCVDPSFRGKGLATRLIDTLRRQIRARDGVPFLHVRDDAPATAALYERLGFRTRRLLGVQAVRSPTAHAELQVTP